MNDLSKYITEKLKLNNDIKVIYKDYRSSHIDDDNYEKFLNNKKLQFKLKDLYIKEHPLDLYGDKLPNISLSEVLSLFFKDIKKFEEDICFNDSIIRERVFDILSSACKVPYDDFYEFWLHN